VVNLAFADHEAWKPH